MDSGDRNKLEQWLERKLRKYGTAEPRSGLESRVLANLAVKAKRSGVRSAWPWLLAGASAAALFISIWLGVVHLGSRKSQNITNPVISRAQGHHPSQTAPSTPTERQVTRRQPIKRAHAIAVAELASEPRLNQFPSPRPLSEQELLFANYAERFPQEAVLIARE